MSLLVTNLTPYNLNVRVEFEIQGLRDRMRIMIRDV